MTEAAQPQTKKTEQENVFVNLLFNIVIPVLTLSKLSSEEYLGPVMALIVALSFPIAYGVYDFAKRKKLNIFSVLGFISTLLTGGMSLLEFDPKYIAIKEAAVPGIIFVIVLISTWTPYPLVKKLLLSDAIFNIDRLQSSIDENNAHARFEVVLKHCSYLVAASFALSSVLNYLLARWIVVSPAGTAAYNEELGRMMALSFPVIALPSTLVMASALFYLVKQLQKISGHKLEHFLNAALDNNEDA